MYSSCIRISILGHVRYINILIWLWSRFSGHSCNFSISFCPKETYMYKKTLSNIEVCSESLGVKLKYWYVECDLISFHFQLKLAWDKILSPGKTVGTPQLNISRHFRAQHFARVWLLCYDMLRYVGCCWLKFKNGQIFHASFVDVAWCCSRLARFEQQSCAWTCALVRLSISNISQQVATVWPNARNMLRSTKLRYVVLNYCDRLAGACKCWATNVPIPCVDMLWSFG